MPDGFRIAFNSYDHGFRIMIILSADVHHKTMGGADQRYLSRDTSELTLLVQYLEIANRKGIRPTVYLTGRIAYEERDLLKHISKNFNLEIGGHTFNAYQPWFWWGGLRRLNRGKWPIGFQRSDALRTRQALMNVTGREIVSWRNHAYLCDENTNDILEAIGYITVSNLVNSTKPRVLGRRGTLMEIPINTLVDHDNLQHSSKSGYPIGEWLTRLISEIELNERNGVVSMLLIHPLCQHIEDNMRSFEFLVDYLADKTVVTAKEFYDYTKGRLEKPQFLSGWLI
jgi:hypothetical protein